MTPRPRKKYWYKGKVLNTCDILRMSKVPFSTYHMRVERGWPLTLAMTLPVTPSPDIPSDLPYEVIPIPLGDSHLSLDVPLDDSRVAAYTAMMRKCYNKSNLGYKNHGALGIKVSPSWQGPDGLSKFLVDMGPRPRGASLRRKDKSKNFTKRNCYWG